LQQVINKIAALPPEQQDRLAPARRGCHPTVHGMGTVETALTWRPSLCDGCDRRMGNRDKLSRLAHAERGLRWVVRKNRTTEDALDGNTYATDAADAQTMLRTLRHKPGSQFDLVWPQSLATGGSKKARAEQGSLAVPRSRTRRWSRSASPSGRLLIHWPRLHALWLAGHNVLRQNQEGHRRGCRAGLALVWHGCGTHL